MDNKTVILVDFDHTLFDTEKFVKFLESSPKEIDYKEFLYDDALDFINYASRFGKLMLFSEGEVGFQKEKIKGTGIENLFLGGFHIFPSYTKSGKLLKITNIKNTILIDDKPEIIDTATSLGMRVVRIRRGKYANDETKSEPNFEVKNLSELVEGNLLNRI